MRQDAQRRTYDYAPNQKVLKNKLNKIKNIKKTHLLMVLHLIRSDQPKDPKGSHIKKTSLLHGVALWDDELNNSVKNTLYKH